jgi:CheY-like chemotaxis protein
MSKLEQIAGRLAHGFSALNGECPEDVLGTATLVSELTDEMALWQQEPAPAGPLAVRDVSAGSRTALVACAGPEDREISRERLQELGYTVLEAASGSQALALFAQHPGAIDLLLADVLMPDMSGREVAERASILKPEMGVIYMSGYAEDEIMFYGILGPGVTALQKPVSTEALARKLAELAEAQYV